ncbi:MAG: cytochrome c3 family protein, partial [Dehalococcoidales bacterium]|nr:cytochrome c3 family protein [Dehalococcoidales bacterium]
MVIFILIILLDIGVTLGKNGPHQGTFCVTTNTCAACHRTRTGQSPKLLKNDIFYIVCHDGTGADTDVFDGIYLGNSNGIQDAGLRGGGFTNALMNTELSASFDETGATATVNSAHDTQVNSAIAWGAGPAGSNNSGNSISLECVNCHNPHGNEEYRILRPKPIESYGTDNISLSDEVTTQYTITYDSNYFREIDYVPADMSSWCAKCHTRYQASDSGNSGDSVFRYRHRTNISGECLSCHVAHGTSATMSGNSLGISWPNGASDNWQSHALEEDSRLLQDDDRLVCNRCHIAGSNAGEYGPGSECAACHRSHVAAGDNLLISNVCSYCHDESPNTGSHQSHFSAIYGPGISDCNSCHSYAHSTHINGNVTFSDNATSLASTSAYD